MYAVRGSPLLTETEIFRLYPILLIGTDKKSQHYSRFQIPQLLGHRDIMLFQYILI